MIPIIPLIQRLRLFRSSIKCLRRQHPQPGKILLLPVTVAVLALSSCKDEDITKHTPPITVTDTQPVGDGLKVIGFALVGAAVLGVLGKLVK